MTAPERHLGARRSRIAGELDPVTPAGRSPRRSSEAIGAGRNRGAIPRRGPLVPPRGARTPSNEALRRLPARTRRQTRSEGSDPTHEADATNLTNLAFRDSLNYNRRPGAAWTPKRRFPIPAPGHQLRAITTSQPAMPIAFKEWAVTVRALAEGEQLVTLRKGGIREENKHFELEHERFFLYPTFDHQRNDLVRESHHPELRRALEEGVWPDEEPPPRALLRDGGIPQPDRVRIRSWAEVVRPLDHRRPEGRRGPDAVPRLDARLRAEAPAVEAPPPAAPPAAPGLPDPAPGHGPRARRVPRLPLVGRDRPRAALRGHPGDGRRGVRPRRRRDPADLRRRRARPRLDPPRADRANLRRRPRPRRGHGRRRRRRRRARRRALLRVAGHRRRAWAASPGSGSPIDPHPGPRPLADIRGGRHLDGAVIADGETTTPEGVPFAESRMAAHLGEADGADRRDARAAGVAAGLEAPRGRARLRPGDPRRRRRRRARARRRAGAGEPALRRGDAGRRSRISSERPRSSASSGPAATAS